MFSGGLCGGWGVGGLLLMIGFWLLIVGLVVWVISRLFPHGTSQDVPDAVDDLDHRLAAGEIDPDAYLRLRGDLVSTAAAQPGERKPT